MLRNGQSDDGGALKWQHQPVEVLFLTFSTCGMSTWTSLFYSLKVINFPHCNWASLLFPRCKYTANISKGRKFHCSWRSWLRLFSPTHRGFKEIALIYSLPSKLSAGKWNLTRSFASHRSKCGVREGRHSLLRGCAHMWTRTRLVQ